MWDTKKYEGFTAISRTDHQLSKSIPARARTLLDQQPKTSHSKVAGIHETALNISNTSSICKLFVDKLRSLFSALLNTRTKFENPNVAGLSKLIARDDKGRQHGHH